MIASQPTTYNTEVLDKKYRQFLKQIGAIAFVKRKFNVLNEEKFEKSIVQIKNKHSSKRV